MPDGIREVRRELHGPGQHRLRQGRTERRHRSVGGRVRCRCGHLLHRLRDFLLGVAEAGFFPAAIYYFSRWLPDSHRGRATSVFLMGSGTATVIVGPISGALMEMHGLLGHAGWQWMFFIEGLFSVVLGFVVHRFLDNSIESADWLTDEEKQGLVATIDAEQAARESKRGTAKISRWKLLADRQMLLFLWIYFAINVALYAVTFWLPSIFDDIGDLSEFQVGLLTSVPWLFAIAAVWVSGRISDRMGKRRPLLIMLLLIGSLGTLLAVYVSPWLGLGALCVAAVGFRTRGRQERQRRSGVVDSAAGASAAVDPKPASA
ncbi:MFS transporter [Streptomyces sp. NPDC055400]